MNRIYILIIVLVSLILWKPILGQVPMGEGYYYFDKYQNQFITSDIYDTNFFQFDHLARISFQVMIPLFKENIHLYMFAQLAVMLLLYLVLYLVLTKITKNSFFSLSTVLIFLASHTGSFSMMATGNYQRFIQRVPNLIPILISFYFLTKYYKTRKTRDLLISTLLYILGFYLAHHSLFMLPLFLAFVLIKTITAKFNFKSLSISLAFVFVLIGSTIFIAKSDHFVPKDGIIAFSRNTPNLIEKTFLQIPNLIIPTGITKYIVKHWSTIQIPYPYTLILKIFTLPLLLLFIFTLFKFKNNSNINILCKVAIIALPIVCFLNLYAYGDGVPHPLRNFGEDRIYFIPSIFSSIILGAYLNFLWSIKKLFSKILTVAILTVYLVYNMSLINTDSNKLVANSIKMESFIEYVKMKTTDRNLKITIIGPSHLMWPNQFADHFYNTNNNLTFLLDSSDWSKTIINGGFDKIVVVDYTQDKIIEKIIK